MADPSLTELQTDVTSGQTPRWQRHRLTGLDELAEHVCELAYDFVPIGTGEATVDITQIYLDRITLLIGSGEFPRHSVRAATERSAIIFATDLVGDAVWDGQPIDMTSLVSLGARSELVGRSTGDVSWVSMLWDSETADEHAAALGVSPLKITAEGVVQAPAPEMLGELRRAVADAFQAGAENPGAIEEPAVRRKLEESILTAAVHAAHPQQDRRTMGAVSHVRAVRAAFEVLETRAGDAIYLAELCEAAKVSERTLRSAFQHLYGVSPIRYLQLRRMELVRRTLRDADPRVARVSEIASRYGFTNLGRFAMEYRQLYGESPSQSLRGA